MWFRPEQSSVSISVSVIGSGTGTLPTEANQNLPWDFCGDCWEQCLPPHLELKSVVRVPAPS